HEQMIVFEARRPVRCKTKFKTAADRATPAGLIDCRRSEYVTDSGIDVKAIARHRSTALHVEQDIVPGIADLASEQSERVDFRTVSKGRESQADVRSAKIGPVALAFEAEHPIAGLPAITDLTAGDTAGCIVTTFGDGEGSDVAPALAA